MNVPLNAREYGCTVHQSLDVRSDCDGQKDGQTDWETGTWP